LRQTQGRKRALPFLLHICHTAPPSPPPRHSPFGCIQQKNSPPLSLACPGRFPSDTMPHLPPPPPSCAWGSPNAPPAFLPFGGPVAAACRTRFTTTAAPQGRTQRFALLRDTCYLWQAAGNCGQDILVRRAICTHAFSPALPAHCPPTSNTLCLHGRAVAPHHFASLPRAARRCGGSLLSGHVA